MRILIDLQSVQGCNRNRGIGRYVLNLTQGIIRNRGTHDIHIALSALFPEAIDFIQGIFYGVLPAGNIHVWHASPGVCGGDEANRIRRNIAEAQREAFFASLKPDMVILPSLFEGFGEDHVTSINQYSNLPTAVVLHDLIPLIYKEAYLADPVMAAWYDEKLVQLKDANLLLANSNSSRTEVINCIGFDPDKVVNISAAANSFFHPRETSKSDAEHLNKCYGIKRPFVMYTGGIDWRKNIEGLIRSFAKLPEPLRSAHQLAIVCAIHADERVTLEKYAQAAGLEPDEVIMTGFVSEDDLLTLYNACRVFAFPSWHEGFGLPALEAMQCGKAVIAANTTSLPEVVGRLDVLFDPHDDNDITKKLAHVLEDDAFRAELENYGKMRAAQFSWDATAQRAITAIEDAAKKSPPLNLQEYSQQRKRLAFISPLPPERSGISHYSAELLPNLNKYFEIDVIIDQPIIDNRWIEGNCRQRSIKWFRGNFEEYDRIIYQFGNSAFHQHMFELLEIIPGVVVLHDFFLSGIHSHMGHGVFLRALNKSHGYRAVLERLTSPTPDEAIWKYPTNLAVLQDALGVIVHSEYACNLADQWYGSGASADWKVVPHLRAVSPVNATLRGEARTQLGIPKDALLICSFGYLTSAKLNDRLISAFIQSALLSKNPNVFLVFVGENGGGEFGQKLSNMIMQSNLRDRIRITGWAGEELYTTYLRAADVAVQLRGLSRGESSGTILDCMGHGLATVVNANGAMAEIAQSCVFMLNESFEDSDLTQVLELLAENPALCHEIGMKAQAFIKTAHSPELCAESFVMAIEDFYSQKPSKSFSTIRKFATQSLNESDTLNLSSTLGKNFPPKPRLRQLLVDVSELVNKDVRTGIQRVVRAIIFHWITNPPIGWTIEPVYATHDEIGYYYARSFTSKFLGIDDEWASDDAVDAWPGDIFIGLDLQQEIVSIQCDCLADWHRSGVEVKFVVYDLLPILKPEYFTAVATSNHTRWLDTITMFKGAVCISRTVADELLEWCRANAASRPVPFEVDWFHLGADIRTSCPTSGLPIGAGELLHSLRATLTFLMVGTIEPRKGHQQALTAFEMLWARGVDVNFVIVGKQGWNVEELIERIRQNKELGAHLHWLEHVTDEYLDQIYAASDCLIVASEGEGFGLPLIEAAQHGIRIIARDLPVFKEVAGEHATYFNGAEANDLAEALISWIKAFQDNTIPDSFGMSVLTWQESAAMLLDRLGIKSPST
jgi:glycosyltransferase involved in cell wall biosynthesis